MTTNGRDAFDLLREWIANDHPVYHFGWEVVKNNKDHGLNYGNGLRDFILDIRSSGGLVLRGRDGSRTVNKAYAYLCRDMKKLPAYSGGYPIDDLSATWTMGQMTDKEFGAVDWTKLADAVWEGVNE